MSEKTKIWVLFLIFAAVGFGGILYLFVGDIAVLNPKGIIALKERDLIVLTTVLMLIIVIPVFILTFGIAWRYRSSNEKAKYTPHWDNNVLAEVLWWGIPFLISAALAVVIWFSCHELDPFKPIEGKNKPLTIQVVALQWKWLFLYPEQKIATVGYLMVPTETPLVFDITADAPMNSFWIPQLGGQIYAMSGMKSKLHLIADEPGDFRGSSANISGRGFAGMTFLTKARAQEEFDGWVQSVQQSDQMLTWEEYNRLVQPSEYHPEASYTLQNEDLFDRVVMKYMGQHAGK